MSEIPTGSKMLSSQKGYNMLTNKIEEFVAALIENGYSNNYWRKNGAMSQAIYLSMMTMKKVRY